MNLFSILLGLLSALLMFLGLIPLLGWVNWFMLPIAVVGAVVGVFGEKKTGLMLNIIVAVVGFVRLILGGGLL